MMIEQQLKELKEQVQLLNEGIPVFAKRFEDAVAKIATGIQSQTDTITVELAEDTPSPPAETKPEETSASLEDARRALIDHKTAHGREATLGLLKRYVPEGAQLIVGNVAKDKYAALIADARGA